MTNDTQAILNDLLVEWHKWAKGWLGVASHGSCAMFAGVKTSRQWDSENDISGETLHHEQMKSFDFEVMELEPVYRTALQINARNLATGSNVWKSPRLPNDLQSRAQLLGLARTELLKRLERAGVL